VALAFAFAGGSRALLGRFVPTLFGSDRALGIATLPDARVLAFALSATLACGLLFGTSPALGATTVDPIGSIREGGPGGRSRRLKRSGQVMVAGQVALAVLLLVAAGLFIRTVLNLRAADLGFSADGVVYARVEPRSGRLPQDQRAQFFQDAVERLARLPGVAAASASSSPPVSGSTSVGVTPTIPLCVPERLARGLPALDVAIVTIAPRFFDTLGVGLIAGRDFTWTDRRPALPVIVNGTLAEGAFGSSDVVGRSFSLSVDCGGTTSGSVFREPTPQSVILAVAPDLRSLGRDQPVPTIYLLLGPEGGPVTLMVKTAGDPAALIPAVRRATTEINASIPTFGEATLNDLRDASLRRERLLSSLLTLFGMVALFVCCLGITGTLAHAVVQRRSEIAIRMAIGARPADVIRAIVSDSLAPVATGLGLGIAGALLLQRWIGTLLFDVAAVDPLVLGGVSAVFLAVTAAAAAIPGRAATRVDPVLALRQ
jgi:predicted permease